MEMLSKEQRAEETETETERERERDRERGKGKLTRRNGLEDVKPGVLFAVLLDTKRNQPSPSVLFCFVFCKPLVSPTWVRGRF